MKKILFRADAYHAIGTGDLVSLIHLSKYFERNGWECHFITKDCAIAVDIANKYKVKNLFLIDPNIRKGEEIALIDSHIGKYAVNVIFLEITDGSLSDYGALKSSVTKACVCFNTRIPANMNLVVNWDVNTEKEFDISKYPETKFLLGPEYVILPCNFDHSLIRNRAHKKIPQTLLISMGGADEFNFTEKIIKVLAEYRVDLKLNVIVGAGYRFRKELEETLSSFSKYEIKRNITDMFSEYMESDVAIASGGLTAFELIATRTPALLVATYEHQIHRCVYFDKRNMAKYLGFRRFDEKLLAENIQKPATINESFVFSTDKIRKSIDEIISRR